MYVLLDALLGKKLITAQVVNNRTFYQAL